MSYRMQAKEYLAGLKEENPELYGEIIAKGKEYSVKWATEQIDKNEDAETRIFKEIKARKEAQGKKVDGYDEMVARELAQEGMYSR